MTMLRENKRYILPFYFKGAPRESVMMELEIRVVRNEKNYGMCSIYMDSGYHPIRDAVKEISENGRHITIEQAEKILSDFKCIAVKENFDISSIEDLREIKHLLPQQWIDGFNADMSAYS